MWYILEDSPGEGWGKAYAISSMMVVLTATTGYIVQSVIEDNANGWEDYTEEFRHKTSWTFQTVEVVCVVFTSLEIGKIAPYPPF